MRRNPTHSQSRRKWLALLSGVVLALAPASVAMAEEAVAGDDLAQGFRDPPASARPRVWWHWMNGNITKDGIRKDMEWMHRVGIGGLQNFDAALATPQVVDHRLVFMSPEWKDAFRYSAETADRLGLELAIAASPGWSETGGPWVPPRDGIKKLVWSELLVSGGRRLTGALPSPTKATGPFADMPRAAGIASETGQIPDLYEDIAVLAFPVKPLVQLPSATYRSEYGTLDAKALTDGSFARSVEVNRAALNGEAVVVIEYPVAQTVRSATVALKPSNRSIFSPPDVLPILEVETGPDQWRKVAELPLFSDVPATAGFAPVTGKTFRMRFQPRNLPKTADRLSAAPGVNVDTYRPSSPQATVGVSELRLSNAPKVDRFEAKAGFTVARDYFEEAAKGPPDEPGVAAAQVLDLTGQLRPDGTLDWTPPPGAWKVIRLGWSLTGTVNHPATAEATGLEVDKMDGRAVARYMDAYLAMYRDAVGPDLFGKKGLRALVTDSIEVGAFNWTPALPQRFRALRGYDIAPWLPALTGEIVGSRSDTERFLYDFRRTIGDLVASDHYGEVAAAAHRNGLIYYGEALEAGRPTLGDDMTLRSHADVPMAAYWTNRPEYQERVVFRADMKGAASVAHIYGQNLVAAESLTSGFNPWAHAPSDLKTFIDQEFVHGINRPVIHTSVHQPTDDKVPGLSLMIFGQYFNRHETWAEMARPWVDYISRSSYLLQQGRYYADYAYFYGEEAPLTGLYQFGGPKDAPQGYAYDFLSADALRDQVHVDQGRLVAKGGTTYRAIYLGGSSRQMTVATLTRLRDLVRAGAVVVGRAPVGSPALTDDQQMFKTLIAELWPGSATARVGQGQVIASDDVAASLRTLGVEPDLEVPAESGRDVPFLHRQLDNGDLYFLSNRQNRAETFEARFRITGRTPEIWRAESGRSEAVSYRTEGVYTVVPLRMQPQDALFVVFQKPSVQAAVTIPTREWKLLASVAGPWDLSFQPGRGAPASTRSELKSLTAFAEPGIRYFSGTTTYKSSFSVPQGRKVGAPLVLDLGRVGDVAEVFVNGKAAGIAWKAPYRVDVTDLVRRGRNDLEVRVANLWVNRLIGDAQPGATKITFTTLPTYKADAPLRPAGLMGPVQIFAADTLKAGGSARR